VLELTLHFGLSFARSALNLGLAFVGLLLRIGVAFAQLALRLPFAELAPYSGLAFPQLALRLWIRRCWYWMVLISRPSRKERSMKAHPQVSRFRNSTH
jgi:hypothetical protein